MRPPPEDVWIAVQWAEARSNRRQSEGRTNGSSKVSIPSSFLSLLYSLTTRIGGKREMQDEGREYRAWDTRTVCWMVF